MKPKKIDAAKSFSKTDYLHRLESLEVVMEGDVYVDAQCGAQSVTSGHIGKAVRDLEGWFYRLEYGRFQNDFD